MPLPAIRALAGCPARPSGHWPRAALPARSPRAVSCTAWWSLASFPLRIPADCAPARLSAACPQAAPRSSEDSVHQVTPNLPTIISRVRCGPALHAFLSPPAALPRLLRGLSWTPGQANVSSRRERQVARLSGAFGRRSAGLVRLVLGGRGVRGVQGRSEAGGEGGGGGCGGGQARGGVGERGASGAERPGLQDHGAGQDRGG